MFATPVRGSLVPDGLRWGAQSAVRATMCQVARVGRRRIDSRNSRSLAPRAVRSCSIAFNVVWLRNAATQRIVMVSNSHPVTFLLP
jgi:hypothetical protein